MKILNILLMLFFCIMNIGSTQPVAADKTAGIFARNMEFYYKNNRPELLPEFLKTFAGNNSSGKSENRLMLAAFFSELLKNKKADPEWLIEECNKYGREGQRIASLSLHLAGIKIPAALLKDDFVFEKQVSQMPASILKWNIASEPAVLHMYWSAFMANGNLEVLDAIIKTALQYGKANQQNARVSADAAALLFECAPRHKLVQDQLKKMDANPEEKKIIDLILRKKSLQQN